MKTIGQILMWLGFLSGALATVWNPPATGVEFARNVKPSEELRFELPDLSAVEIVEDGWSLIPWTWYLISAGVCVVGVVMIRVGIAITKVTDNHQASSNIKDLKANLSALIANTTQLQQLMRKSPPSKITHFIDDVLAKDFRDFAEGREALVPEFGLTVYADIMTNFAAAERTVNRAWSAAADGYVDEAATCIDRSISLLNDALADLVQAGKES